MKVTLQENVCIVEREKSDRRATESPGGESLLLHRIKLALIAEGYDVIKKRMWKDGHLYGDDTTQHIRTRNAKTGFYVYDNDYAIRNMCRDFNQGRLALMVERF